MMAKIIQFKKDVPLYGECSCGCDLFLLHLQDGDEMPEVIALECSGCREVIPFENELIIECEME